MSTARQCQPFVTFFVNCLNPVEPGLSGFKQLINFLSSSWFAAKSVEQMIVEQSNFEQFTPTWSVYLLSSTIQLRLQIDSDFQIQLILQTEYDFIDSIDTMNKFSRFQDLIQRCALLLWWRRRIRINLTINNIKQINCWWGFEISILWFVSRLINKIKFMFFIEKVKKPKSYFLI